VVVASLRRTLDETDANEKLPGHSQVRDAEEEAVTEVPAEPEAAILAEHAFRADQRL
jgi:hypothetical protein